MKPCVMGRFFAYVFNVCSVGNELPNWLGPETERAMLAWKYDRPMSAWEALTGFIFGKRWLTARPHGPITAA